MLADSVAIIHGVLVMLLLHSNSGMHASVGSLLAAAHSGLFACCYTASTQVGASSESWAQAGMMLLLDSSMMLSSMA